MANFAFDNTIPAVNNDPSDDQPNLLLNNVSEAAIWEEDHVGFNADDGGTHLQSTYSSMNTPGAQTNPQSVAFTGVGVASAVADYKFINQNGTFPLSIIRAYAVCDATGAIQGSQSINVVSITPGGGNVYTVVLSPLATNGLNFAVFAAPRTGSPCGYRYTITGADTFNISFTNISAGVVVAIPFAFCVMEL